MATKFRTQDSRASWARKLNALLKPAAIRDFAETPQTLEQWQHQLHAAIVKLRVARYTIPVTRFRLGETRQIWCRKLNKLSAAIAIGPAAP